MKKLLVLAIATFGAVMAQAVTADWIIYYETTKASTWVANGAMAMVFAESDMKDVLDLINTETGSTLQTALEEKTLKTSAGGATTQKFIASSSGTTVNTVSVEVVLPDNNRAFSMIFSDDTFSEKTDFHWTNARNGLWDTLILIGGDFVNSKYSSVPEPGMLALLALGVAGLALKRKVA